MNSLNQEFAENNHLTDAILADKDVESLLIAVGDVGFGAYGGGEEECQQPLIRSH